MAGLIFQGYPGHDKSVKQVQASSGLLYDVFARYDPENLLLFQAHREVLEQQLEQSRLGRALERIGGGRITCIEVERPTPLAFAAAGGPGAGAGELGEVSGPGAAAGRAAGTGGDRHGRIRFARGGGTRLSERWMTIWRCSSRAKSLLLAERALWWPRASTAGRGRPSLGKGLHLSRGGIPLPIGTPATTLPGSVRPFTAAEPRRLVVLGDLFHAKAGRIASNTVAELRRWRSGTRGARDPAGPGEPRPPAGDPPAELGITCLNPPAVAAPFVFQHHPSETMAGYTLAGHLHPGLALVGPALFRERLPCFVVGSRLAVLPAFGGFTGYGTVRPGPDDRLFVIADEEILPIQRGLVRHAHL